MLSGKVLDVRDCWINVTLAYIAGGVAQLEERYVRNVEAAGSSPVTSTRKLHFSTSTTR